MRLGELPEQFRGCVDVGNHLCAVCVCVWRTGERVRRKETAEASRAATMARTLNPCHDTVTDFTLCSDSSSSWPRAGHARARHSTPSTVASHGVRRVQAFVAVPRARVIASRRRRRDRRGGAGAIRRAARETRWRARGVGCRGNVAGISNAMRAIVPGTNVYRCRARGGCVRAIDG